MPNHTPLFNDVPLNVEEIIEHCRTLIFAMVQLEHIAVKESLMFMLWDKIDQLYQTFHLKLAEHKTAKI